MPYYCSMTTVYREYLLPYRLGDEPLEEWRELYKKEYGYLLDSIYTGSDVVEAANLVSKHLQEPVFIYCEDFDYLAHFLKSKINREKMIQDNCFYAYPGDSTLAWNIKELGPFYLPAWGDTIVMNEKHYILYRNLIECLKR